jgi:multidrug efflux pump subunit AcrA (membrane-fusion protein)
MPNEIFMTVVSPRPLIISGSVAEKDLRHLNLGTSGWATPTAAPEQRIPVTVTAISRVPSAPGKFAVTLAATLGANHGYLAPGMGCAVKLGTYSKADALTVPSTALHYGADQKPYVIVVDGESTKNISVQLGRTSNGQTEITSGLKAGDPVKIN